MRGVPHGWVDTVAWRALKRWAVRVVDSDLKGQHGEDHHLGDLEQLAKEEVSRCGGDWATLAGRAVHRMMPDRQDDEPARLQDNGSDHQESSQNSQELRVDNDVLAIAEDLHFVEEEEEDPFGLGDLGFDNALAQQPLGKKNDEVDMRELHQRDLHQRGLQSGSPQGEHEPHAMSSVEPESARARLRRLQAIQASRRLPSGSSVPLRLGDFRLGNLHLHVSHTLRHHRGVVWCWACGAYASETLRGLQGVCSGAPGRGRVHALKRLRQGATPRVGMEWPLAVGACRPSGPIVA